MTSLTWKAWPAVGFRFLLHFPLFSNFLPCFALRLLFTFRNKFLPGLDEWLCHRYYFVVLASLPEVVDSHTDSVSRSFIISQPSPALSCRRKETWWMWGWRGWCWVFPGCWGDPEPVFGRHHPGSSAPTSSWWTEPHPRRTFWSVNYNKSKNTHNSSVPVWGGQVKQLSNQTF